MDECALAKPGRGGSLRKGQGVVVLKAQASPLPSPTRELSKGGALRDSGPHRLRCHWKSTCCWCSERSPAPDLLAVLGCKLLDE